MPYFLFKVTLVKKDRYGRYSGFTNKEAIRQEPTHDIDNVWRKYNKKFQDHYGYLMTDFSVVMLSKLDPRVIRFVKSSGTNPEADQWTVIKGGKPPGSENTGERS